MAQMDEQRGTASFLISEANGIYRSRDEGIVAANATDLGAGTILGRVSESGNFVAYDPDGEDGSEEISGILFEAATGIVKRTIVTRDAEVNGAHLIYPSDSDSTAIATANEALAGLGIIVR